VAVPLLVGAVEGGGEVALQRHGELERLPAVAQVRLPLRRQVIDLGERTQVRRDVVAALVAGGEAEGGEDAGRLRYEHRLDPELLGERARVQRTRSAERDEREVTRVVA